LDVAFSPNGLYLATASWDRTARLWDLNGNQVAVFADHHDVVTQVAFSPTGDRIATIGFDGPARVWDFQGNQRQVFAGHQGLITRVEFSPDGSRLATTGEDFTTRIWRIDDTQPNGQQIAQFEGRLGAFNEDWSQVYILQKANNLIETDWSVVVTAWPVDDLDTLVTKACDYLTPYLTHSPRVSDADRALCGIPPRNSE
jgi:WD40 repeat protein